MPGGDGTGLFGMGPGTGRRTGSCKRFFYSGGRFNSRRFEIISALIPITAALIREVLNPNGILRSFSNRLLVRYKPEKKEAIDAEFTVIDEDKSPRKKH